MCSSGETYARAACFNFQKTTSSSTQGDQMKKFATLAFTIMLAASLSFAQGTTGSTDKAPKNTATKTTTGKKTTKAPTGKKSGGKKGKKSSGGTTTPAPK
jgi:hypothetical protein